MVRRGVPQYRRKRVTSADPGVLRAKAAPSVYSAEQAASRRQMVAGIESISRAASDVTDATVSVVRAREAEAARVEREQDLAAGDSMYNELSSIHEELFKDPEKGYLGKRGIDALEGGQAVLDDFEARAEQVKEKYAKNERTEKIYGSLREKAQRGVISAKNAHEAAESRAYAKDAFKAAVSTTVREADDAVRQGGPEMQGSVREAIGMGVARIEEQAKQDGRPKEALALELAEYRNTVHEQSLSVLVAERRTDELKVYLKENGGDIDERILDKYDRILMGSERDRLATAQASEAYHAAGGDAGAAIDAMRDKLQKEDPAFFKMVQREIEDRRRLEDYKTRKKRSADLTDIRLRMRAAGGDRLTRDKLEHDPVFIDADDHTKERALSLFDVQQSKTTARVRRATAAARRDFAARPAFGTPGSQADVDVIEAYAGRVPEEELQVLLHKQSRAAVAAEKASALKKGEFRATYETVFDGLKLSKKQRAAAKNILDQAFVEEANRNVKSKGYEGVTTEWGEAVLKKAMADAPTSWWKSGKSVLQVAASGGSVSISDADTERLGDKLRARYGRDPTDKEIRKAWALEKMSVGDALSQTATAQDRLAKRVGLRRRQKPAPKKGTKGRDVLSLRNRTTGETKYTTGDVWAKHGEALQAKGWEVAP